MKLTPRNWSSFQHYKDRSPAWIKLHKKLLYNFAFQCLPIASKALAPMLWLLASDYQDGRISASLEELSFHVRMRSGEFMEALKPLIDNDFFVMEQDASDTLADCYHDACLEKEKEEENIDISSLRSDISCPEPSKSSGHDEIKKPLASKIDELASGPEIVRIPTNRYETAGEEYPLHQGHVDEFKKLYPAVDVVSEFQAMRGWALSHGGQRKTFGGMLRFVTSWLKRAQDRGGQRNPSQPSGRKIISIRD